MRILVGVGEIAMKREGTKGQRLYDLHKAERGKSDESPTWLKTFANARAIQYLREIFLAAINIQADIENPPRLTHMPHYSPFASNSPLSTRASYLP
jgi:hypothetical protein